ncbi:insulinoma-associated protein 1-like [Peromyscus leucopus]|uniref:insulinoma-associated protein 1-like n=1 Tax=Peromyscus leucopus TaxID=10041 RepID=UPI00188564C0|nr:insulinoma-associated protein 1-like [Peromyscus leucopus]
MRRGGGGDSGGGSGVLGAEGCGRGSACSPDGGASAVPADLGVGRCALRAASRSPGRGVTRAVPPAGAPATTAAVTRDKAAPGRGRAGGSRPSQWRWARPQLRLIGPTSNQTPGKPKPLPGLLWSPPS